MKITVPTKDVHYGSDLQWQIYPEMMNFCAPIDNPKINATLGLMDAGYYEKENLGEYGWAGPTRGFAIPVSKKYEFLVFQLDVSDEWIRDHKAILDSIQVTPGGQGQRYEVYKRTFDCERLPLNVTMGYFKTEYFDEAFNLFRRMKLVTVEKDMIHMDLHHGRNYLDFVSKRQICESDNLQSDSLLETCDETLYMQSSIFKGLEIKLLSDDIEPNRSTLLELFANV